MATDSKPALPTPTELATDLTTIQALVDKYSALATGLPGTLGSALGGLRTALRGFSGHLAQQNAVSQNAAVPASASVKISPPAK